MKLKRQGDAREFEVELLAPATERETDASRPSALRVKIEGREVAASLIPMADGSAVVELNGRRIHVAGAQRRSSLLVTAGSFSAEFTRIEGRTAHRAGGLAAPEIDAPMPGKVLKVHVSEGQAVEHGEPLIVLEAMKMETTLYAESPAIVAKILVVPGQMVDHGARLIELSPAAVPARPPEPPSRDD